MTGDLSAWTPREAPGLEPMEGRNLRLEPITDERHFEALYEAFRRDGEGAIWRWLPYGPFADEAAFLDFARRTYLGPDILFHAFVPKEGGRAIGVAALMRTDRANGVTEIGHICLSPSLQGTRAASEGFFLLMRRVFDELGYRRLEWKCNDANAPSKRAAERLGFAFEGLFRQHMIVKNENRDTAWYAIIDREWPAIRAAFAQWLEDDNFDAEGRQKRRLSDCRSAG